MRRASSSSFGLPGGPPSARGPAAAAAGAEGGGRGGGVDLLHGLRRLREDCFRVAEYSNTLDAALDRKRRAQLSRATVDHRARRRERLEARVVGTAGPWDRLRLVCILQAWAVPARRLGALCAQAGEESQRYWQLRTVALWRRGALDGRWARALSQSQEELAEVRAHWDAEIAALQARIWAAKERSALHSFKVMAVAANEELQRTCYAAWARRVAKVSLRLVREEELLKSVSRAWSINDGQWRDDCFRAWSAFGAERREQKGEDKHSAAVDKQTRRLLAAMMGADEGRLLQSVVQAWRVEAVLKGQALAEAREDAEAEQEVVRVQEATQALQTQMQSRTAALIFAKQAAPRAFFDAWKDAIWRRRAQREEESLRQRRRLLAQWGLRTDEVFLDWRAHQEGALAELALALCFAEWRRVRGASLRERRLRAEGRYQELCQELHAWRLGSREMAIRRVLGGVVGMLRLKACASLRTAWQTWSDAPTTGSSRQSRASEAGEARKELDSARCEVAKLVTEKKLLEDELSGGHRRAVRGKRVAREIMGMWAEFWSWEEMHRAMVSWKLSTALDRLHRTSAWREMQAREKDQGLRARHNARKEAQRNHAMNAFQNQYATGFLSSSFRNWQQWAQKEHQERTFQQSKAELEEGLRQQEQRFDAMWKEEKATRNDKMAAATLMRGTADTTELLRLAVWDWKNAIAARKEQARSIMKLWNIEQARRVFSAFPWVVLACFAAWCLEAKLTAAAAEAQGLAEQTWLEALEGQRHARLLAGVCGALVRAHREAVQRAVLAIWQRFREESVVDKVAVDVQRRCGRQEEEAEDQLHSAAEHRDGLRALAETRVTREHQLKNLHLVVKLWRQVGQRERLEWELAQMEAAARELPETQRRFEEAVCEEWAEKSLSFHGRVAETRVCRRALGAWQTAVQLLRRDRHRLRGAARAMWAGGRSWADRRGTLTRLVFNGWQAAVCRARRRWLERRCRWLEGALAAAPGLPATSRAPAAPGGGEGGLALAWALEPLAGGRGARQPSPGASELPAKPASPPDRGGATAAAGRRGGSGPNRACTPAGSTGFNPRLPRYNLGAGAGA